MFNQSWTAEEYANHASFVSKLGAPVIELLNPKRGEAILDIGCGGGAMALHMQNACAEVIGIDSSASMVRSAQTKGIPAYEGNWGQMNIEFNTVFIEVV